MGLAGACHISTFPLRVGAALSLSGITPPAQQTASVELSGKVTKSSLREARRVKKTCQWHVFSQSGEQSMIATGTAVALATEGERGSNTFLLHPKEPPKASLPEGGGFAVRRRRWEPPIHPYTPRPFSPLHPHPVWKTGVKPSAKGEKTAILAKFARPQGKLSTGCGFVDKPKSAESVRRSSPQNPSLLAKKYAAYASRAGRNPPQEARIYKRMGFSPQGCG